MVIRETRTFTVLLLVCVLLAGAADAFAQAQSGWLLDRPGQWSTASRGGDCPAYRFKTGETAALNQKLAQIAEALRKNSLVLSSPRGFDPIAELWINCEHNWDRHDYNYGVPGSVDLTFRYYALQGGKVFRHDIEPPHLHVRVNDTMAATGGGFNYNPVDATDELRDAARRLNELFLRINVTQDVAPGVTLYQNGSLVVANPNRPPYWVPVSVGEVFDLLLAYHRAEVRNTPAEKFVLDEVTKIYGRFTKAQLGMPAHHIGLSAENITGITWDGTAGGFPVMRFNKDYFDKALPRTAVQFISMPFEEKTEAEIQELLKDGSGAYFPSLYLAGLDRVSLGALLRSLLDTK